MNLELPTFFRIRQTFERPQVTAIAESTRAQVRRLCEAQALTGKSVAITAGSRGIANIASILRAAVDELRSAGAAPLLVPAMGSHGGATAEGQLSVLAKLGITEQSMGCPIRSSMETVEICSAAEGFPVHIDAHAAAADRVLVVNRIKPHTRFAGEIQSGLMKMMLIGLGKQLGAELYHRLTVQYSFDQIVKSVSREVIKRCGVLGGIAILENAYDETADIVGLLPSEIEEREPSLLKQAAAWLPALPLSQIEFLIVDAIGKNISGTGMDTNIIGRKKNDHAAIDGDSPSIHHIYVRRLTEATAGNGSGIGLAELCHRRAIEQLDRDAVRMNCVTAGHVGGAMLPLDFPSDREALQTLVQLAGYVEPQAIKALWIRDTLHLAEIECSSACLPTLSRTANVEILSEARPLEFDPLGDLLERFN